MENSKKCMIIGASPIEDGNVFKEYNPRDYFVICADGGYDTALKYKVKADYIVGDFDSVKNKPKQGDNVTVLPVEKDVTDTLYAAHIGLKNGCTDFLLIGCLGGSRCDHTMANYNVMLYISQKGARAVMVDNNLTVFLLRNNRLKLTDMKGYILSVFPFGTNSCNVTYKGLKYPLYEDDLYTGGTLMGVSNEIIDCYAEITVNAGCALVMAVKNK